MQPYVRRTDAKDFYPARHFCRVKPEIAFQTELEIKKTFVLSRGINYDCLIVAKVASHGFTLLSLIFKELDSFIFHPLGPPATMS